MSGYVSPFGQIKGLPQRLEARIERFKRDKSYPWVGTGLIADLEAVLRLLSLEEFGQWLHTHPDDELQRWGAEVLANARDAELLEVERDDVRDVLVECGALSADDTETDIPALLRALLS